MSVRSVCTHNKSPTNKNQKNKKPAATGCIESTTKKNSDLIVLLVDTFVVKLVLSVQETP